MTNIKLREMNFFKPTRGKIAIFLVFLVAYVASINISSLSPCETTAPVSGDILIASADPELEVSQSCKSFSGLASALGYASGDFIMAPLGSEFLVYAGLLVYWYIVASVIAGIYNLVGGKRK